MNKAYFHLYLVSDSTGETLIAVSRAAAAQYQGVSSIEHVYPMTRNEAQLDRIIKSLEEAPGIVLYTLVEPTLAKKLENACQEFGCPCLSVLDPVLNMFQAYLGQSSTHRPGAQHVLNGDYFKRIDALNYTMMHDDGQLGTDLESADIILVGISRTSKTPTSIYLANRGYKTANYPLVPGVPIPPFIAQLTGINDAMVASAPPFAAVAEEVFAAAQGHAGGQHVHGLRGEIAGGEHPVGVLQAVGLEALALGVVLRPHACLDLAAQALEGRRGDDALGGAANAHVHVVAGAAHGGERVPAQDVPMADWHRVFSVNATGTFLMSRLAAKQMIEQKRASARAAA